MGRSMLWYQLTRLKECQAEVVLSVPPADEAIREVAASLGVRVVDQIEGEMIASHARVMRETGADIIVLAGADDPLLEPWLLDGLALHVVERFGRRKPVLTPADITRRND